MSVKKNIIMFIVMFVVGILFNPMNILAYRLNDIYLSYTLIYGGLVMASNMIWAHEIVHFFTMNYFNHKLFYLGLVLSITFSIFLLRDQFMVDDKQWVRRMIGHHSTAITTSKKLLMNKKILEKNSIIYNLAKSIIYNQELEIKFMKTLV